MFTGLVSHLGRLERADARSAGSRIAVSCRFDDAIRHGESIAVNGVCLTALPTSYGFEADVSPETLRLTTLGALTPGSRLNLERALSVGDRLGGHIVQGHVDTIGELRSIDREGEFALFRWSFEPRWQALVVPKGSIAVDGISLTVVEPDHDSFAAALIPETLERTNLRDAREGDRVNLEFDMMGKYAMRILQAWRPAGS